MILLGRNLEGLKNYESQFFNVFSIQNKKGKNWSSYGLNQFYWESYDISKVIMFQVVIYLFPDHLQPRFIIYLFIHLFLKTVGPKRHQLY